MPESSIQQTCIRHEEAPGMALRHLYENHRWFDLRDELEKTSGAAFYRGAAASAFGEHDLCRGEFDSILQSGGANEAWEACELLSWMYMREGKFQQALLYASKMGASQSGSNRRQGLYDLLSHLGQYPEQCKLQHGFSILPYEVVDGNMFIPVQANGRHANFMIDSGASLSLVTESEAQRLGFRMSGSSRNTIQIYGATGALADIRLAVADDLWVAKCHLKHVTFAVLQDDQFDFPAGYKGALGLPVLLALETLRWDPKGNIEISFPSPAGRAKANICFDNGDLIVETRFRDRNLNMVLDTGSGATVLWLPFTRECPQVINEAQRKGLSRIYGISGEEVIEHLAIDNFHLRIGNHDALLDSVNVLMKRTTPNSDWFAGRLGFDLMQADCVTLDFKSMTLALE
jgi:hypothetical protein